MFTTKDLTIIDHSYFNVIHAGSFTITLQSKNTKQCWHILHQVYPTFTSCQIYHTHKEGTQYHLHGRAPTLMDALEKIKKHDLFQLNGRKKAKQKLRF